jgi:hypothetical protein
LTGSRTWCSPGCCLWPPPSFCTWFSAVFNSATEPYSLPYVRCRVRQAALGASSPNNRFSGRAGALLLNRSVISRLSVSIGVCELSTPPFGSV